MNEMPSGKIGKSNFEKRNLPLPSLSLSLSLLPALFPSNEEPEIPSAKTRKSNPGNRNLPLARIWAAVNSSLLVPLVGTAGKLRLNP
jgi:hypothetical protein